MENVSLIIGILSGSLGTLIIGKIFDIIMEKIKYKRELKRLFFEKKIDAAEQAVRFYNSAYNAYLMQKQAFELVLTDTEYDPRTFMAMTIDATSKMKQLWDESSIQLNAISMYFDFSDSHSLDNSQKMLNTLSTLNAQDAKARDLQLQMYTANQMGNMEIAKSLQRELNAVIEQGKLLLPKICENLDIEASRVADLSKQIRLKMKEFDI